MSPSTLSAIFDSINTYTTKKDIVRALKISTGKKKKYLESLFDISKKYDEKPIWLIYDLEKFFDCDLDVCPFFRREFFIPGYDWNGLGQGPKRKEFEIINRCHYEDETIIYVSACGLKKMLLILSIVEQKKQI